MKTPAAKPARARHGGIVDVVFSGESGGRGLRLAGSLAVILSLYGGAIALSEALGAPVANWSAEMAARIHDAIARDRAVDLTPPPPAPPPPPPPTAAPVVIRAPQPIKTAGPPHPAPAEPARAGKLTAVANEPVDFTGAAFVVGGAATFPGGTTAARGTGTAPGAGGPPASASSANGGGTAKAASRARGVSLDQAAWSCPWPAEADAEQVNERTVILRAAVRADGRADTVDLLSDPGFGFGPAARACALVTRFEPARNADGQPVAAQSAPIRVHFFR